MKLKGAIVSLLLALAAFLAIIPGVITGGFTLVFGGDPDESGSQTGILCITEPGKLPRSVPQPLNSIITAAAKHYNTDPIALAVLYHNENDWTFNRALPPPYGTGRSWRTSPDGAQGPLQFMPGTWTGYKNSNPAHQPGNVLDLTDAMFAAANYLSNLGGKAGTPLGSPDTPNLKPSIMNAIVSYHSGPGFKSLGPAGRQYIQKGYEAYRSLQANSGLSGAATNPVAPAIPADIFNGGGPCGNSSPFPARKTGGNKYPNTDHMTCGAGTDIGVAITAQGNRIRLCKVHGFTINASSATNLDAWMRTAQAAGFNFSGGGYRDSEKQIMLRRINCGTSQYAIYEMPSGQCNPRTAIPGTSQHEQAEAVDFVENGKAVTSYASNEHKWLAATGPRFGFYPLRSGDEAWHFSRTGG